MKENEDRPGRWQVREPQSASKKASQLGTHYNLGDPRNDARWNTREERLSATTVSHHSANFNREKRKTDNRNETQTRTVDIGLC